MLMASSRVFPIVWTMFHKLEMLDPFQQGLDSMLKLGMWLSGMVDIEYQTMFKKIQEAILLQPMMFHMQIY